MATVLVVKTGLCVASGMMAASFFSVDGALVSAPDGLVLGAAHRLVARTNGRIQKRSWPFDCFVAERMRFQPIGRKPCVAPGALRLQRLDLA
jgi:hypothetical protein